MGLFLRAYERGADPHSMIRILLMSSYLRYLYSTANFLFRVEPFTFRLFRASTRHTVGIALCTHRRNYYRIPDRPSFYSSSHPFFFPLLLLALSPSFFLIFFFFSYCDILLSVFPRPLSILFFFFFFAYVPSNWFSKLVSYLKMEEELCYQALTDIMDL